MLLSAVSVLKLRVVRIDPVPLRPETLRPGLDRADSGQPVTISTVAARAGVSRAWLYTQTDLRQQIQARAAPPSPTPPAASTPASDASLRQRLSLALERVRELTDENDALRRQIAGLHGQLRATQLTGHAPLTDTVHDTNTQIKTPTDQDHLR